MKGFFPRLFSDIKTQFKNDRAALKQEFAARRTFASKFRAMISENPHYFFFMGIVLLGLMQFYICVYVTNGDVLKDVLFYNPTDPFADMFMDYYNPVRSLYMDNPYTQVNAMYPPINFLLLALFTGSIPVENIAHDMTTFMGIDYDLLLLARNSREAMWSYLFYVLFTTVIFIVLVNAILKKNNVRFSLVFDITVVFSWGFLYMIDRGNFLLIVIDFLLFFLLSEQSSKGIVRELGLVAFSIGICLKIYPVFLSVYLLHKKEYSRFIRLAIYSIIIFLLPFAFYGGLEAIMAIVKNVFSESSRISALYPGGNVNFSNIVYVFQLITGFSSETVTFIGDTFPLIIAITCVISSFILKPKWKRLMILTLALLLYPSTTTMYNLVYIFIPLIMFVIETKKTKFDYVYATLFAICMIPLPYVLYDLRTNMHIFDGSNIIYSQIAVSLAMLIMLLLLVGEAVYNVIKALLKRLYESPEDIAVLYFRNKYAVPKIKTDKLFILNFLLVYMTLSTLLTFINMRADLSYTGSLPAEFCLSISSLSPVALFVYIAYYMLKAGKITLHTPKVLAPKLFVAFDFLAAILAASIIANEAIGIECSAVAVYRYILGIFMSMSVSVIILMLISVFSVNNKLQRGGAIFFSIIFGILDVLSVAFPLNTANLFNPAHLAVRYLHAGSSMQGLTGFTSFVYQGEAFIVLGIFGLFTVFCYYIKDYEKRNNLHHYFSPSVILKKLKYRDRHNI